MGPPTGPSPSTWTVAALCCPLKQWPCFWRRSPLNLTICSWAGWWCSSLKESCQWIKPFPFVIIIAALSLWQPIYSCCRSRCSWCRTSRTPSLRSRLTTFWNLLFFTIITQLIASGLARNYFIRFNYFCLSFAKCHLLYFIGWCRPPRLFHFLKLRCAAVGSAPTFSALPPFARPLGGGRPPLVVCLGQFW